MPKYIYNVETGLNWRQQAVADLYVANYNLLAAVVEIYPKMKHKSQAVMVSNFKSNIDFINYVEQQRAKLIDKAKWDLDKHLDYLRSFADEMRLQKKYNIAVQLEKTILEYTATTKLDITTNGQSINTIKIIEIKKED